MIEISDGVADVIRTIACRNLGHAMEILEDSEHDFLAAGMMDKLVTMKRINSALEQFRRDLMKEMGEVRMIHLTTFTCNACPATVCETSTEDGSRPSHCPYGLVPDWRRGDE